MFSPFGSGKGGRSGHSARQSLDRALEQASAPPAQQQVAELHRELELTTLMLSEAEEDAHSKERQLELMQHMLRVCETELRDEQRRSRALVAEKEQLQEALDTANHVAKTALDVAGGGTEPTACGEGADDGTGDGTGLTPPPIASSSQTPTPPPLVEPPPPPPLGPRLHVEYDDSLQPPQLARDVPVAPPRAVSRRTLSTTLQWSKVPESRIGGSVWEQLKVESDHIGTSISDAEIERIFGAQGQPSPTGRRAKVEAALARRRGEGSSAADGDACGDARASEADAATAPTPPPPPPRQRSSLAGMRERTTLLEPKRAATIGILIRSWRISAEAVRDALIRLDARVISSERAEALLSGATPRQGEVRLIEAWLAREGRAPDALGEAEMLLLRLGDVPRLESRLRCLIAEQTWSARASACLGRLCLLAAACKEVAGSAALREVLGVVLHVGNLLNERTYRGGALGFQLDTLERIGAAERERSRRAAATPAAAPAAAAPAGGTPSATPPPPKRAAAAAGLAEYLWAAHPRPLRALASELPSIDGACKLELAELTSEAREMLAEYERIQADVDEAVGASEADGAASHAYTSRASAFVAGSRTETMVLRQQLGSTEAALAGVTAYFAAGHETDGEACLRSVRNFVIAVAGPTGASTPHESPPRPLLPPFPSSPPPETSPPRMASDEDGGHGPSSPEREALVVAVAKQLSPGVRLYDPQEYF